MFSVTELHLCAILMDIAAVLLLTGLIIHTTVYRRRGRIEDRIFFLMIVMNVILAVSDAGTYALDRSGFQYAPMLSFLLNDIFYLMLALISMLLTIFFFIRAYPGKQLSAAKRVLLLLPLIAVAAAIIINHFTGFLFDLNYTTNEYTSGAFYPLLLILPGVYGIVSLFLILKIDRGVVWLLFLLILLRVVLEIVLPEVTSTAMIFAMGLVFVHIHVMGEPFYGKEEP